MRLRIGVTPGGSPVVLDVRAGFRALIVADPGHGKTTLMRFVARWWTASGSRHVHVWTGRPHEWTGPHHPPALGEDRLPSRSMSGSDGLTAEVSCQELIVPAVCDRGSCLRIVDGIDQLTVDRRKLESGGLWLRATGQAGAVPAADPPVIVTSTDGLHTGLASVQASTCLALIESGSGSSADAIVAAGQGRLDWPAGALVCVAGTRCQPDLPRHRWNSGAEAS